MDETCDIGDDVGLIGHCKVFLGRYLGHYWGSGGEGGRRRGWKAGDIQSKVKKQMVK